MLELLSSLLQMNIHSTRDAFAVIKEIVRFLTAVLGPDLGDFSLLRIIQLDGYVGRLTEAEKRLQSGVRRGALRTLEHF